MTTLVWFRQDLRLADNPALSEAVAKGKILPVFILEDAKAVGDSHPLTGASHWWLHHSLASLKKALPGLVLRKGDPRSIIPHLVEEMRIKAVYWNRCYEPHAIARDSDIKADLKAKGLDVRSFKASLLFEPFEVQTKSGGPYKVYSPFWRAAKEEEVPEPLATPHKIETLSGCDSDELESFSLLPKRPDWAKGWDDLWSPGEEGAAERLSQFLKEGLSGYGELRNRPDLPNVSRLSAHLHFGEISPRQVWHETLNHIEACPDDEKDGWKFLSELAWREFSYHLLYHFPKLPEENWKPAFDAYPWRESEEDLKAWQRGQTGYPIVDAGMRELWQTGWMHNRVRMIVASFLIKHLRLHWHHGEEWFRDTLVDADLANNSASWQWVAGSGADAAPYFRIFNPMTQGEKFDPEGDYVRKWVPELAKLDTAYLHAPFEAPEAALRKAGVELGKTYPKPIVDHAKARQAALDGYEAVKEAGQDG
ncbi:cryptochrome/photolyase family protein [Roseibium litorale]|uniref:Deoxyribodipyrimidine photo-lyase n=1 Tax=Roseibium litorale TaxID=2803841 RepID=A0ABR9CRW5_9HYPH|nr:deoxyribodipyrimidine photo-lyase [Roseibium litorale]MBD8893428.1 deoxyribodipyrimidine photo-lyase [Roseibium litorale]